MNLFDKIVSEALKNNPDFSSLRIVVEKELLHHHILKSMRENNLTKNLTFIGGTALRLCYGGIRLSEDLDFTGGEDFNKNQLSEMGELLRKSLEIQFEVKVSVSEPIKETGNTDTWKLKIETRPESRNMPSQRINIDICSLESYEIKPVMLKNHYGVDMGTSGIILQVQSREEIFADKLIAFGLRPNRIKYRDLWDILWLNNLGIKPKLELISAKLKDRNVASSDFRNLFNDRIVSMGESQTKNEFIKEMQRFLPSKEIDQILLQDNFWDFLLYLMKDLGEQAFRL